MNTKDQAAKRKQTPRHIDAVATQLAALENGIDPVQFCNTCTFGPMKAMKRCEVAESSGEDMAVTAGGALLGSGANAKSVVVANRQLNDGSTQVVITAKPLNEKAFTVDSCGQETLRKCLGCQRHVPTTVWLPGGFNEASKPFGRNVVIGGYCKIPAEGIVVDGMLTHCDRVEIDYDDELITGRKAHGCWDCKYMRFNNADPGLHATAIDSDLSPYEMDIVRQIAENKDEFVGVAIANARLAAGKVKYANALGQSSWAWSGLKRYYLVRLIASVYEPSVSYETNEQEQVIVEVPQRSQRFWLTSNREDGYDPEFVIPAHPEVRKAKVTKRSSAKAVLVGHRIGFIGGLGLEATIDTIGPLYTGPRLSPGAPLAIGTGAKDSTPSLPVTIGEDQIGKVTPIEGTDLAVFEIMSPYHKDFGLPEVPERFIYPSFGKVTCRRCDGTGVIHGLRQDWTKGTVWRDWRSGATTDGTIGCGECGGKEDGTNKNKGSGKVTYLPAHQAPKRKTLGFMMGCADCEGGIVPGEVCYLHGKIPVTTTKSQDHPNIFTGIRESKMETTTKYLNPSSAERNEMNPQRVLSLVRDGANSHIVDGNGNEPTPVLLHNLQRSIADWRLSDVERKALAAQYDTVMADQRLVTWSLGTERVNLAWNRPSPIDPWAPKCTVNSYDQFCAPIPDDPYQDHGTYSDGHPDSRPVKQRGIDFTAVWNSRFGTPRSEQSTNPVMPAMSGGTIEMLVDDQDYSAWSHRCSGSGVQTKLWGQAGMDFGTQTLPCPECNQPARLSAAARIKNHTVPNSISLSNDGLVADWHGDDETIALEMGWRVLNYIWEAEHQHSGRFSAIKMPGQTKAAWLNIGGLRRDPKFSWPKAQESEEWIRVHAAGIVEQEEALISDEHLRLGQIAPPLASRAQAPLVDPRYSSGAYAIPDTALCFDTIDQLRDYLDQKLWIPGDDEAGGFWADRRTQVLGYNLFRSKFNRSPKGISDSDIASVHSVSESEANSGWLPANAASEHAEFYACSKCWLPDGSRGQYLAPEISDPTMRCPRIGENNKACGGTLIKKGSGTEWLGATLITMKQLKEAGVDMPRAGSPIMAAAADRRGWLTAQRLENSVCDCWTSKKRR